MNNTTYLCLVLAVLCSLVVSRVRLALLYTASPLPTNSSSSLLCPAIASAPLLLVTDYKEGPTHGHKTKSQFCSMEVGTSRFSIFGMEVSE